MHNSPAIVHDNITIRTYVRAYVHTHTCTHIMHTAIIIIAQTCYYTTCYGKAHVMWCFMSLPFEWGSLVDTPTQWAQVHCSFTGELLQSLDTHFMKQMAAGQHREWAWHLGLLGGRERGREVGLREMLPLTM